MSDKKMVVRDNLVNLISGLGTDRAKSSHSQFAEQYYDDGTLLTTYRQNWLASRIVDIPAQDATREWRGWQAEKSDIEKIERIERLFGLQLKVQKALQLSRLFGGAAIYIGTNESDPAKPLNVEREKIKHLTVLSKSELSAGEVDDDIESEYFGQAAWYELISKTAMVRIHPSRLVKFVGKAIPDTMGGYTNSQGWGDSVLVGAMSPLLRTESTMANTNELVYEANTDVIGIPDFMSSLGDAEYRNATLEMIALQMMGKGVVKTLLMDAAQKYEKHSYSFAGLPEIAREMKLDNAGSAGIPYSILFGDTPSGLNSNGDADKQTHYDNIKSFQNLEVTPRLHKLDELLIWNALGSRPEDVYYIWNNLWYPSAKEQAEIGKIVADTIVALNGTALYNSDALSKASINMLTERGVIPGLESAVAELGVEEEEDEVIPVKRVAPTDSEPRPLYVSRKVVNSAEILKWAKGQGFSNTLEADDLHVTVTYSKAPVDWMKMGQSSWSENTKGQLEIKPGGPRVVEPLGNEGAVVLMFGNNELTWRNREMQENGASWDYEDYQPHVTITYEPGSVDIEKVEPYRGKIVLGPEIFEEIN